MTIAPVIEAGYVNIYCSDITERLQAEEAFKESQDFLDKIIQTSGDPIFVKDREHCWVLINEAFCRFIGHNKEQLIGKSDYEFFPKCEADEFWEKDEIVFKNGLENLNEESFTDASGFQHIIQTKKNLYTDFAGNQYLIGIIRDITELKHIEQELRENESKFRNYVNFAPHGIFIADKDGNYIEVNSAASKITGYSKDELLTMNLIDLVSEESMEIAGDQFGNVVNNGFSSGEFAFVKKDGSKGFWSVDAVKLTDDRFLGFVVDITERKKAEQELIVAKYHAEESDKLKTAFLQNMSHEIRTPLNGIIGFSDLLNEENLSGEDIKEFTSMIKQSGKRLLEIVNNVLDISKIQTGQVKIDLRPISINSIFSDLFTFFSLLAKAKNIKLNCYINPDNSQFQVLTDEAKLFQILTNLINNAIKFTESGSIDFGYNIKDDIIQFFVKDTGLGLSYDVFDRIFERFTQIDNSISRGYEGAGLGLAICKGLVEMLEGKIWLESEINKGTTFFFTLPYRPFEQPLQTIINKPERSRKLSNGKILIAEDDWTSFQYLNKILIKSDVAVIHAENGEQTVEFVKNMPDIDLILMDIRMPVMDGIDATKLIKQIRPDLPIIAQTAYAFSEERRMILSIGCDEYLAKPINKDKINALIIKYIR
jgi:PAS domain S-box-containing protein